LVAGAFVALALSVCCENVVGSKERSSSLAEAARGPTSGARRLRILCLHGYHGSGDILRAQMASLASGLGALAELFYIDAPTLGGGDFGWWHAVAADDRALRGDPGVPPGARRYRGWQQTRDFIVKLFETEGPFDGVLGFSQGAALTGLLVGLRSPDGKPTVDKPLAFDFAVMVGGFASVDPDLSRLYESEGSYALPSLHVIGRSDFVVPSQDSRALAARFRDPLILEHDGGHVIPSAPDLRGRVAAFLEERQRPPSPSAIADRPREVALWPGRADRSMRLSFPASAGATRLPAFLIFQGGAYATSFGSGAGSAEWLAAHGMVGILVEYGTRGSAGAYPASFADAARAMRLVRRNAPAWGIDAERIGVLGYSAGGHLASLLSTQPDFWLDPRDDLAGRVSARPDLVGLAYPLVSFVEGYRPGAFAGSVENFFGREGVDERLRRQFSSELHVTAGHPPVFIWTTDDDALVPSSHARRFVEACRRAHVPVTFTLYPHGPHGLGLALGQPGDVSQWTGLFLDWIATRWGAP
jgi:acetyl esterase/lipase